MTPIDTQYTLSRHSDDTTGSRISGRLSILIILVFSLALNLWGNSWGAPDSWHPDELTRCAKSMAYRHSLNPKFFAYGGLHYSVLAVGAVVPAKIYGRLFDRLLEKADTKAISKRKDRTEKRIIILARSISALMATLTVLITFLMGQLLFGRRVGLLAALFLSLSPFFVEIAHFATVDTPANFWYWLACLLALTSWKRGNMTWFTLACLTAGFAIGTKVDRLVILIPLFLSYILSRQGWEFKQLLQFALLLCLGYVLANPALITSFFEFVDGTSRETFYNILREDPDKASYLQLLSYIKSGLGLPLALTVLFGLGFVAVDLVYGRNRQEIAWLAMTIFPFYLLFSSRAPLPWYVPFFFPALTIFAAYGCFQIRRIFISWHSIAIKTLVGLAVISTMLITTCYVLEFSNDSRYQAARWIEEHIPTHSTVEVGPRAPAISKEKYHVLTRSASQVYDSYEFARRSRDRLDSYEPYRMIRTSILGLEELMMEKLGKRPRSHPYRAWFDRVLEPSNSSQNEFSRHPEKHAQKPNYVVLIDYLDYMKVTSLQSPNTDYEIAGKFRYNSPLGIDVSFPFVNPQVYVFKRQKS